MDRPLQNEKPVVHFHMRGGGALCGSVGGEGVYNGEGVNCPKCQKLMAIDDDAQAQLKREPKTAARAPESEPEQP